MSHILINQTVDNIVLDIGRTVPGSGQYSIDVSNLQAFQKSSDVITHLSSGDLIYNDGVNDISSVPEAIRLLNGGTPHISVIEDPPFSNKRIGGKSLYSRITGKSFAVAMNATTTCDFSIDFPLVKFNGLEIIGATPGDSVNLFILDTPNGDLSGFANYPLNQFGYTVFPSLNYYKRRSNYDADLMQDMQIRLDYTSITAKTIYINYDIHELK